MDPVSLAVVAGFTAVLLAASVFAYNPSKGLLARRGEPGRGGG
jgi:ABC-2 type transport system permease protein